MMTAARFGDDMDPSPQLTVTLFDDGGVLRRRHNPVGSAQDM